MHARIWLNKYLLGRLFIDWLGYQLRLVRDSEVIVSWRNRGIYRIPMTREINYKFTYSFFYIVLFSSNISKIMGNKKANKFSLKQAKKTIFLSIHL